MRQKQGGFTLVEIAIVLVIIGLLLGGVLKGQELINSAKVKSLANDFRTVPLFVYGYQDRFRALPGDDPNAVAHLGAGTTQIAGATVGNGVINGNWDDPAGSLGVSETVAFWEHVRRANLAAGPLPIAANADLPTNSEGGRIGIESFNAANPVIQGLTGTFVVCSDAILGRIAVQLDTTLDDGRLNSGSVRAIAQGTARNTSAGIDATAAAFNPAGPHTVCMAF